MDTSEMLFRLIVVEMSYRVVISHINQESSGYAITQVSVAEHNTILFLTSVKSTMGLVDSIHHSATQYTVLSILSFWYCHLNGLEDMIDRKITYEITIAAAQERHTSLLSVFLGHNHLGLLGDVVSHIPIKKG